MWNYCCRALYDNILVWQTGQGGWTVFVVGTGKIRELHECFLSYTEFAVKEEAERRPAG